MSQARQKLFSCYYKQKTSHDEGLHIYFHIWRPFCLAAILYEPFWRLPARFIHQFVVLQSNIYIHNSSRNDLLQLSMDRYISTDFYHTL